MKRLVMLGATVALVTLSAMWTPAAVAATSPTHAPVVPAGSVHPDASCSRSSCVGKDPDSTGCDDSAKTIGYAYSSATETVSLRYSTTCHTWWGRISVAGDHEYDNGCAVAEAEGDLRVRLATQKYSGGTWSPLRTYVSTWKSCGTDLTSATGWTVMGEAGNGDSGTPDIKAHVCERYVASNSNGACSDWYIEP